MAKKVLPKPEPQKPVANPRTIVQAKPVAKPQTVDPVKKALATILPGHPAVTQAFGNINPGVERFSKGVNYGTDFAVKPGTPVGLPQGQWKVVEAYSGAKNGYLGDSTNRGYGNSILVQNAQTGEKLRFSHLSTVGVKPGQIVDGGRAVALSGATGNVTGPHLDLEYYDSNGRISNVLNSSYAGGLQGKGSNPLTNAIQTITSPNQQQGMSATSSNPQQQPHGQGIVARQRMSPTFSQIGADYGNEQQMEMPTWLIPSVNDMNMQDQNNTFNSGQDMVSPTEQATPTPRMTKSVIPQPNI